MKKHVKLRLESLEDRTCPSTVTVGAGQQYATITAALQAATPGETIKVLPGIYTEQVVIGTNSNGATLNNIKLVGSNQASIISPTVDSQTAALLEVNGAQNVSISGFTITGPGNGPGSIGYGILVDNGGSATITNDHVTNIRDNPISGDQNGIGIFVTGGSATISNDVIDNYQKGGILVDGSGSSANITNSTVNGSPNNTAIPSNGIQISDGATANVSNNQVTNNEYKGAVTDGENPFEGSLPLAYQGVGILLFESGKVNVSGNNVVANDIGIYVFTPGANSTISNNTSSFNTFDGMVLEEVPLTQATPKTVTKYIPVEEKRIVFEHGKPVEITVTVYKEITETVMVTVPTNLQVTNNSTNNNTHDGIELVFDPTGSESGTPDTNHNQGISFSFNKSKNNGNDGVQVEAGSTGNSFSHNTLLDSGLYDAQDSSTGGGTAGTGNTWSYNQGITSSPVGLVKPLH